MFLKNSCAVRLCLRVSKINGAQREHHLIDGCVSMQAARKRWRFAPSVDQLIALAMLPAILVILAILYVIVVPLQGRPFFFSAERMRSKEKAFIQHKIRTMQPVDAYVEQAVLGGDLQHRVTPVGVFLRKTRLDELPQIFNVLRGDMVFIGPRPPLRKYVEANPTYADFLCQAAPGITGLATVMLHQREERILSKCKNAAETDRVFREHCIPRKIRLDMLYQRNKSARLKLFILWRTASRLAIIDAAVGLFSNFLAGARGKPTVSDGVGDALLGYPSRNARLK